MREFLEAELARLNGLRGTLQSRDDVLVTIGQVIATRKALEALDMIESVKVD